MPALRIVLATLIVTTLWTAGPALAADPAAQLGKQIEAFFALLADPQMKDAARGPERRAAVRALAEETFDFTETARRALGSHWDSRSPDEQARFVRAFTELIDHAYLRRVEEYGGGERVVVLGQKLAGRDAMVSAQVVAKDGDTIPIEFAMLQDGERWRAYDVRIGGMSLVGSYRVQFNKLLRTVSYETMMERLEAKTANGNASPNGSASPSGSAIPR